MIHQPVRPVPGIDTPAPLTWREALPTLVGQGVTLREARLSDAEALFNVMRAPDVSRFVAAPPATVELFRSFIHWAQRERSQGRYAFYVVIPAGGDTPVGLFQIRQTEQGFVTGQWGFALSPDYWGADLFMDAASLVLEFAFTIIGVHRLEARAAVANLRGNAALSKLGAVHEGVLRSSFRRDGRRLDQSLWSLLADEWDASQVREHSVH